MSTEEIRRARATLLRMVEPPAPETRRLIAAVGPVEAARLLHSERAPDEVVAECRHEAVVGNPDSDLRRADVVRARLVIPEDDEWPDFADTNSVGAEPIGLWVRSAMPLRDLVRRAICVDGARAATLYGESIASDLSYELARRDFVVWSGASYGIASAAHRGGLVSEGLTVAALPCGVDVDYPMANRNLLDRIIGSGGTVSEYPPGVQPSRARFGARSQLLAFLTGLVLIVEAGKRSGSLPAAAQARSLGRPVCAVPGPLGSVASAGCHRLIQDGAHLVTSAQDVIDVLQHGGIRASEKDGHS
ncbi:DNA-processing protein DprA [Amycolatopsis acidicola]|uniref:DNA-processing protein DprA n=1 Tax=Amycolatopsis acidicola TaxID=2596893 RepID=A0A5N0V1J1_9PSEU|nr:DNA-processing protein DprA [Amycolatopsis acidicola]KAA9157962.1 DNA-processing protein DprA [Amycolatopsis acidicola]